ncbi:hypothetical protein TRIP_E20078 [uncultured Spirochaetota bacterium]|nr:hypothetical protein TRIP_E20078 [uncultured Spirochaetota bacterium]
MQPVAKPSRISDLAGGIKDTSPYTPSQGSLSLSLPLNIGAWPGQMVYTTISHSSVTNRPSKGG